MNLTSILRNRSRCLPYILLLSIVIFSYSGCDIYGYDYHVKFRNHTNDTLLLYIKGYYIDTFLGQKDYRIIVENSSGHDSLYSYGEIVNPKSCRIMDSYFYRFAWPEKGEKKLLMVCVFNKTKLLSIQETDTEKIKMAQIKTLFLSFDQISKNEYVFDYY